MFLVVSGCGVRVATRRVSAIAGRLVKHSAVAGTGCQDVVKGLLIGRRGRAVPGGRHGSLVVE